MNELTTKNKIKTLQKRITKLNNLKHANHLPSYILGMLISLALFILGIVLAYTINDRVSSILLISIGLVLLMFIMVAFVIYLFCKKYNEEIIARMNKEINDLKDNK